ncbi:MAG: acetyl-CoA carboxylase biotin carboxyl carrier protein [Proteobacteria bacterium]|nr:acetyl-CoA carboxylase biotin carboxyl carrier protein [Pseudomonadota bacterium]
MDIRKVKKLIELLEESGVAEIEIHEGEESVRISRGSTVTTPATTVHVPQPTIATSNENEVTKPPQAPKSEPSSIDNSTEGHVITSPMVGVFYTSPSPDDPEFISKGQNVKVGDVLCIIEAMKIMNQIESDVSGKLERILVENGEAVEYGQPLFIIDPS